jgi:hypothetical protein
MHAIPFLGRLCAEARLCSHCKCRGLLTQECVDGVSELAWLIVVNHVSAFINGEVADLRDDIKTRLPNGARILAAKHI